MAVLSARRLVAWQTRTEHVEHPVRVGPMKRAAARAENVRQWLRRDDRSGKQHSLACAAPSFDGLLVEPVRPFSFWRALGRVTEARGFRGCW